MDVEHCAAAKKRMPSRGYPRVVQFGPRPPGGSARRGSCCDARAVAPADSSHPVNDDLLARAQAGDTSLCSSLLAAQKAHLFFMLRMVATLGGGRLDPGAFLQLHRRLPLPGDSAFPPGCTLAINVVLMQCAKGLSLISLDEAWSRRSRTPWAQLRRAGSHLSGAIDRLALQRVIDELRGYRLIFVLQTLRDTNITRLPPCSIARSQQQVAVAQGRLKLRAGLRMHPLEEAGDE